MPRRARVRSKTNYYHILMRGNNKAWIFDGPELKAYFMKALKRIESEEDMDLAAWCIMDNHVHLVARIAFESLERVLKRLNVSYASYYNKRTKNVGHVFQGRAKSLPLESDESLVNNIRYVHNNPLKARIVSDLTSYKWTSMNSYLNGPKNKTMNMVKNLIGKSNQAFLNFHEEDDDQVYLDINEVMEEQQAQAAQQAIEVVCRRHSVQDKKEIFGHREIMKEMVKEVIMVSGYSGRQTAEFLGLTEAMVRRLRA